MVSAHSARQKKDIYGKPFVHSFFAVAGHFVAAGNLSYFLVRVACRKVSDSALCVVLSGCLVNRR